jgi:uncharacterized protein YndB with AHSA1/START domain
MRKILLTRIVAAPPEDVFVFFVPQRMPYWYGAEMKSCFEMQRGAGDFATGLRVRISGQLGRRAVSHIAVVTAYEYERLLEWRFEDAYGVRGRERWELERAEDPVKAATRVRFTCEYEIPARMGRLIDWLWTRHALARRNRDYLERLARLAERK